MLATRRKLLGALALLAILLGACTGRAKVVPVALKVSAQGSYEVNGKEVSREKLEDTLAALRPNEGAFVVHLQPDKSAPQESKHYAMGIAQRLGAKIGVVGNEQF
jgi:biopolymer transport protein ExbD